MPYQPDHLENPDFLGGKTNEPSSPVTEPGVDFGRDATRSSTSKQQPPAYETPRETTEIDQELVELRQRERDLEVRKDALAEAERRITEYHTGRKEMVENLTRGLGLLEEELIRLQRNVLLIEETQKSFTAAFDKVNRLNHKDWAESDYANELTRALTTIENARMEWNSARVKIPILDEGMNSNNATGGRDSSGKSFFDGLQSLSAGMIFRLGIVLHWPILLVGLIALAILVLMIVK